MTFLNPLFLLALAAAGIPLIIHLFNFRKPKRINFSSLAFLHELEKSTMQRVRIKQWLLLALRTLAIAALVLAFARPTMTGSVPSFMQQGRTSTAIVFDNSNSMSVRDGSGEYLEQARNIAVGLVDEMELNDEVFLHPTSGPNVSDISYQNLSSARQAIMEIREQGGSMVLSEVIRQAATQLATSANPNRELYIVADLQRSTLVDSLKTVLPDDIQILLIPVGGEPHDNIALTDVRVLSRILSEGQVVRMEARVENHGDRDIKNMVISLFLEGERVAQATADIGPDAVATIPLAVTPRATGWLHGRIEVQDSDYEADDERSFTIFIPEERKLLLVDGVRVDSEFLRLALSAEMTAEDVRFVVTHIGETDISGADLTDFDTVILNGVSDLSSGERSSIVQFVADGGGVLMFPGNDLVVEDYNQLFASLGAGSIESIVDGG